MWQPIETAPRDGTRVLLWGACSGDVGGQLTGPVAVTGCFSDYAQAFEADPTDYYTVAVEATHWMPLPAPPANGEITRCADHPTGRVVDKDGKRICSTCGR
jgi:hypothetical protein